MKSSPEPKMGYVGSKTWSLGQFLEKPCVHSRRHRFDTIFMKLCQNFCRYKILVMIETGSYQIRNEVTKSNLGKILCSVLIETS